ncbi:uncharacterized protein [Nicotiana sylvestris]|uniref:uncharacterized protein n=1 Tax=Nicotiana sylvestris TaxID=4096 RepID=UPI00388C50BB
MEIRTERIKPNNVCLRAFDGIKRDTIGEIDLILTIGPVDFKVTFQVLDMDTSYNFLLGRPWIQVRGSYLLPSIKCEKFFSVDFHATETDVTWANERKSNGWALPQPIPHLYKTFVKHKYTEEEENEAFTDEEIEDICGAMRQMLYEAHMVQPGEGSSTTKVQFMGPNAKLQNWKATPFPVKRESWWSSLATFSAFSVIPGCNSNMDGKTRMCVDYRDLDKASPKDNFPLPNIHILVDNCAKHEIQFFMDCYAGYHQVLMD